MNVEKLFGEPAVLASEVAEALFAELPGRLSLNLRELVHAKCDRGDWEMDEIFIQLDPSSLRQSKIIQGRMCFLIDRQGEVIRVVPERIDFCKMPDGYEPDVDEVGQDFGGECFVFRTDQTGSWSDDLDSFGFDSLSDEDEDGYNEDLAYGDGKEEFAHIDDGLDLEDVEELDILREDAKDFGQSIADEAIREKPLDELLDEFPDAVALLQLTFAVAEDVTVAPEIYMIPE